VSVVPAGSGEAVFEPRFDPARPVCMLRAWVLDVDGEFLLAF